MSIKIEKSEDKERYFSELVETYKEPLYWHIRKIVISHDDADDVLQNSFIKAWKNLEKFRGESKISTWLYQIATNESINFIRSASKKRNFVSNDEDNYLLSNLASDSYINATEIELRLQEAIIKLPQKQRLVFNMRYYDDMKFTDIAEILDTSVGALKASYHHARKKLEKYLTEEF